MDATPELETVLTDLARVFNRGEAIDVRLRDGSPHAALDGSFIAVNPDVAEWYGVDVDRANEVRLLRDTVSHETAHIRFSDLRAKSAIVSHYLPDGVDAEDLQGPTSPPGVDAEAARNAQVAAQIYNIAEDAYVNHRRCAERPGLRATFAFKAQILAGDDDVAELPRSEAILAGIQQVALLGGARGYDDLDHDLRRLLAYVRDHLDTYRRTDDVEARAALARRMADAAIAHLPDVPEFPDAFEDLLDAMADASMTAQNDADEAEGPPMDAEDLAAAIEDLDVEDLPDADEVDVEDYYDLPADAGGEGDEAEDDGEGEAGGAEGADAEDGDGDAAESGTAGDAEADGADTSDEGEDADHGGESDPSGDERDEPGGTDEPGDVGSAGHDDADDRAPADDPLADTMADMDAQADDGVDGNEWHGVDPDHDVSDASEADRRRAARMQDRRRYRTETDMGQRRANRDERADTNRGHLPDDPDHQYGDVDHETVRDLLRATGLAEDVRAAFRRFKTEDVTVRAEDGEELDTDAVIDHMAGDYGEQRVYRKRYTSATGGRTIGVALDATGSMDGEGHLGTGAMIDAKVALGALYLATYELEDDLVASAYSGGRTRDLATNLVTGPDEDFAWEHLDAATPAGYTCTAHGILDVADLLDRAGGRELVLLCVTDGLANVSHDDLDGANATEDAAIATNMARRDGITVIGMGVGERVQEDQMAEMFGVDGYVLTSSESLVDDLISVYRDQLDLGGEHVRFE